MHIEREKTKQISSLLNQRKALTKEEQILAAQKIITETEQVDVETATQKVLQRINQKPTISILINKLSRIAAILFIPVLIISLWSVFISTPKLKSDLIAKQEIICPAGMRTKVELSDGSKVWLNAGSKMKFPVAFVGKKRNIELEGEAYFEVAKNKNKPFIVRSEKAKVKVLGTSFNFKSYKEEELVEVVLKEGKVLFESAYDKKKTEQILVPGNRLALNKNNGDLTLQKTEVNKYIAWHENKLVFDESPINEVAEKLERWYGIDVEIIGNGFGSFKLTTTFENEPIQQVLELIGLSSPVGLEYHSSTYKNDIKGFTKPMVTITKKELPMK